MEATKACFICRSEKPIADYSYEKNATTCAYCAEEIEKRRNIIKLQHQANIEEKKRREAIKKDGYKVCMVCQQDKLLTEFDVTIAHRDREYRRHKCRECEIFASEQKSKMPLNRHEVEKRLERKFGKTLAEQGIFVQYQVRCKYGIADIVTPDAIYEVKASLSRSSMLRAIAQVLLYQKCINPSARVIIVGHPCSTQPVDVEMANSLDIEVIIIDK